jgi:hypothetical protein
MPDELATLPNDCPSLEDSGGLAYAEHVTQALPQSQEGQPVEHAAFQLFTTLRNSIKGITSRQAELYVWLLLNTGPRLRKPLTNWRIQNSMAVARTNLSRELTALQELKLLKRTKVPESHCYRFEFLTWSSICRLVENKGLELQRDEDADLFATHRSASTATE